MEDNIKNEVSKTREKRVLFEPPEPLFPDNFPKRRPVLPRIAAFLAFAAIAVGIWAIAVYGISREGDEATGSESETGGISESGAEDIGNTEAESGASTSRETEGESAEASDGVERDSESTSEERSEETSEDYTEECDVTEADLSQAELGEANIMNYSNKAVDAGALIDRGFIESEMSGSGAPLVMIIHTHTSEKYLGGGDAFSSVVSAGDELSRRLNALGLTTLHCTVIHDGNEENAYINAKDTIKTMTDIYPTVKYVIDLHRLELEIDGMTVKTQSGASDGSAQIRLTVSSESGEDWHEDLALVLALRGELNRDGDRICMPAVISQSKYNSDLSRYYIMADIGSSGNSVSEARAAAKRLAEALAEVILKK